MSAEETQPSAEVEVADTTRETPEHRPAEPTQEWGSEIMLRFVRDLGLAYTAAKSLVKTSFVPASYQGKPEEAAAAIVTGLGMGLDPLAALRSMDVIQGTPAFRAITIRALVQSHGHEIWVEESNQQRAIVKGRRKGHDKVETSMWDIDRARRLNLLGKSNWKNQPEAMLVARATTEVGRLIAADALLGMAYSIEELEDGVVPESAPTTEVPKVTRTVARRRQAPAEPAAEVVVDEEPAAAGSGSADSQGFECPRCGRAEAASQGVLCASCEDEVEAEIEEANRG